MSKYHIDKIENDIAHLRFLNRPDFVSMVDVDDFKLLIEGTRCWYIKIGKGGGAYVCKGVKEYSQRSGKQIWRTHFLHWYILEREIRWGDDLVIDHINRNSLDNRKSNLRFVSNRMNSLNRSVVKKGVCYDINRVPSGYSIARKGKGFQLYFKKKYIKYRKDINELYGIIDKREGK